jgi:hypothetical protein
MESLFDTTSDSTFGGEDITALLGICGGETRAAPISGMRALMLAILQDGIQAYLGKQARARTEAECWVLSGRRTVFSFVTVCEALGLEPDWVLGALERLRARHVTPRAIGRLRPNVRRAGIVCKPRARAAA